MILAIVLTLVGTAVALYFILRRKHVTVLPLDPSHWLLGAPNPTWTGRVIDIPQVGSINCLTQELGSLAGKKRITLRYHIDMAPGVKIVPVTDPSLPSIITLYFQREGDDWSAQGEYEAYRWYATSRSQMPIVVGTYEMSASLDDMWTAVLTSKSTDNPAFADAKANARNVGFVLGGGTGYGHGIQAVGGPATLTILDLIVE